MSLAVEGYSVVIPTRDRIETLCEVLEALEQQTDPPPFEVVVVDDGSSDGTLKRLSNRRSPVPLKLLRQSHQGPAAARNRGVVSAEGRYVAFLGDDTIPARNWLRTHDVTQRRWEENIEVVVVGYTSWHPRMQLTQFLRYINEFGLQFGYSIIDDPDQLPFNFFYTSNVSLPRAALLEEPFRLEFPYPAWEDTELSYRLSRRGVRMVYESTAVVEHDHPTDLSRFQRRQEMAGYSAVVFFRLHPELGSFLGLSSEGPPPLPRASRQRVLEAVAHVLQRLPVRWPWLWEEILRYHYIVGLRRGWSDEVGQQKGEET